MGRGKASVLAAEQREQSQASLRWRTVTKMIPSSLYFGYWEGANRCTEGNADHMRGLASPSTFQV